MRLHNTLSKAREEAGAARAHVAMGVGAVVFGVSAFVAFGPNNNPDKTPTTSTTEPALDIDAVRAGTLDTDGTLDSLNLGEKPCGPAFNHQELIDFAAENPDTAITNAAEKDNFYEDNEHIESGLDKYVLGTFGAPGLAWIEANIGTVENIDDSERSHDYARMIDSRSVAYVLDVDLLVENAQCDPETGQVYSVGNYVLKGEESSNNPDIVYGIAMDEDQFAEFLEDSGLAADEVLTIEVEDEQGNKEIVIVTSRDRCNNPLRVPTKKKPTTTTAPTTAPTTTAGVITIPSVPETVASTTPTTKFDRPGIADTDTTANAPGAEQPDNDGDGEPDEPEAATGNDDQDPVTGYREDETPPTSAQNSTTTTTTTTTTTIPQTSDERTPPTTGNNHSTPPTTNTPPTTAPQQGDPNEGDW